VSRKNVQLFAKSLASFAYFFDHWEVSFIMLALREAGDLMPYIIKKTASA
jgi:hypothetical protein